MLSAKRKIAITVITGVLTLAGFACSHTPAEVTEDIHYLKRVTSLIDSLKQAYESRNLAEFLDRYPTAPPDDRTRFKSSWSEIQSAGLEFEIDRIFVADDTARVFANWELSWVAEGSSRRSRGHVLFELEGRDPVRLTRVGLENPFLVPSSPPPGGP